MVSLQQEKTCLIEKKVTASLTCTRKDILTPAISKRTKEVIKLQIIIEDFCGINCPWPLFTLVKTYLTVFHFYLWMVLQVNFLFHAKIKSGQKNDILKKEQWPIICNIYLILKSRLTMKKPRNTSLVFSYDLYTLWNQFASPSLDTGQW